MPQPKLLVATGNPGKMREYRVLLKGVPFELVSLADLGITEEVDETGLTFQENARLKTAAYATLSGLQTLADDSGLEVDALGGDPGIYSARYGGDSQITDEDRVRLLLRNMEQVPWERRTARFQCVIAVSATQDDDPAHITYLVGSVAGMIQYEPKGDEGFGYDPVFYLPSHGQTMAQLPLAEKNRISHRSDAARKAVVLLNPSANGGRPNIDR